MIDVYMVQIFWRILFDEMNHDKIGNIMLWNLAEKSNWFKSFKHFKIEFSEVKKVYLILFL